MTIPYDLAPAACQIGRLADGVTEQQFGDPTPCPDWPVVVMLNHLVMLTDAFTDGARKKPREDAPEPVPELPTGWRELLRARLDGLVEAWRDPAAWQGEATVGGVTLPADADGGGGRRRAGRARLGPGPRRPASRTSRTRCWCGPR